METVGRTARWSEEMRAATRIRSAEPMLVPPNFMTSRFFIAGRSVSFSIRSPLADNFQNRLFHLVGRHTTGIEIFRIRRLRQRSFTAAAVALIPLRHFLRHGLF